MIKIDSLAWNDLVAHAESTYPDECCGALLGRQESGRRLALEALPLENSYAGSRRTRYELSPRDFLKADRLAEEAGMELVGIYHSHPDADAYFSETDLKNSCPWYSFVVLSIREGKYSHSKSFLPDEEQANALEEELVHD